jgi:xanthine dehydrogenase YagS FAD-binding subunit
VNRFEYLLAEEALEAVAMVHGTDGARFIGGGTNLVDLLKLGVLDATRLVDVSRLTDDCVVESDRGVHIGAAARNAEVAADPVICKHYPSLAYALLAGASGQIRNMATIGGNFLQATRCRYFQDPSMSCNKRLPGSGCPAIDGEHHNLAILGASPRCVATHPSDMAVAMSALDAELEILESEGSRPCSIHDLYCSPEDDPSRDTTLGQGALITGVNLPSFEGWRQNYRKVRERTSFAFAIASVAGLLRLDAGHIADVHIALGAVAHKPWRARTAEERLLGEVPRESLFRAAMDEELRAARPLSHNAFKIPLVTEVSVRMLSELAGTLR